MGKGKFILSDNEAQVARVRKGVEKKKEKFGKGYCPCVAPAAHSEDTVCPCKDYREEGKCICGLYKE